MSESVTKLGDDFTSQKSSGRQKNVEDPAGGEEYYDMLSFLYATAIAVTSSQHL